MSVGAKLLHALPIEDDAEVFLGHRGLSELDGGDGGVEGGIAALFRYGGGVGDGAEHIECLQWLAGLEGELADLGLRLWFVEGARGIDDHAVVGGDGLVVAA